MINLRWIFFQLHTGTWLWSRSAGPGAAEVVSKAAANHSGLSDLCVSLSPVAAVDLWLKEGALDDAEDSAPHDSPSPFLLVGGVPHSLVPVMLFSLFSLPSHLAPKSVLSIHPSRCELGRGTSGSESGLVF